MQKRIGLSLKDFQQFSDQWMLINRGRGLDVIETTFAKVVQGDMSPHEGLILSV